MLEPLKDKLTSQLLNKETNNGIKFQIQDRYGNKHTFHLFSACIASLQTFLK